MECKHELTVQRIFLSEMGVNKVRYRRNRRDNYLVRLQVSSAIIKKAVSQQHKITFRWWSSNDTQRRATLTTELQLSAFFNQWNVLKIMTIDRLRPSNFRYRLAPEEGDHSSRDENNQSQWGKKEAFFHEMFQSRSKIRFFKQTFARIHTFMTHKVNWIAGETPWEVLW